MFAAGTEKDQPQSAARDHALCFFRGRILGLTINQ